MVCERRLLKQGSVESRGSPFNCWVSGRPYHAARLKAAKDLIHYSDNLLSAGVIRGLCLEGEIGLTPVLQVVLIEDMPLDEAITENKNETLSPGTSSEGKTCYFRARLSDGHQTCFAQISKSDMVEKFSVIRLNGYFPVEWKGYTKIIARDVEFIQQGSCVWLVNEYFEGNEMASLTPRSLANLSESTDLKQPITAAAEAGDRAAAAVEKEEEVAAANRSDLCVSRLSGVRCASVKWRDVGIAPAGSFFEVIPSLNLVVFWFPAKSCQPETVTDGKDDGSVLWDGDIVLWDLQDAEILHTIIVHRDRPETGADDDDDDDDEYRFAVLRRVASVSSSSSPDGGARQEEEKWDLWLSSKFRDLHVIQDLGGLCTSGKTGLRKASNFPDAEHKSGVNVFDGVSNSDGGIDGKSLYPTRFAVPPDIDGVGCSYLRRRLQLSSVNTHTLKASIPAGSAGGSSTRSFIRST